MLRLPSGLWYGEPAISRNVANLGTGTGRGTVRGRGKG